MNDDRLTIEPASRTGPAPALTGQDSCRWAVKVIVANQIKETRTSSQGTRTTWELHPDSTGGLGFESEVNAGGPYNGAISQRHYLTAGGQAIGVLVSTGSLPALATWPAAPTPLANIALVKVEYWHKDHLGSTAATTDHAGNLTARYAYDPFGKRRNTNGTYDPQGTLIGDYNPATNNGTDRGFTGHEHLDDVGIVHINPEYWT